MTTTLIDPGTTHRCDLPNEKAMRKMSPGAHVRCDDCAKDWWLLVTWAGDSWVEWVTQ